MEIGQTNTIFLWYRLDFTRLCDLQKLGFLCKMSECQNVIREKMFFSLYCL